MVCTVHCRLKQSITSPAYVEESFANETLERMRASDKCDVIIISPLHGSAELQFKHQVSQTIVFGFRFSVVFTVHVVSEQGLSW